jgi:uncharacterized protein YecT (DUF1311 family)/ATP-dependent protease ClpP protease subunit
LSAATFKLDLNAKDCQLRLEGKIEEGDLKKIKAELKDFEVSNAGPTLCLNSAGGDFVEALEIANFVASGYPTRIKPNAVCLSACAWIFLSGTNLSTGGSELSRVMSASSVLAFHAPYIDPSTLPSEPSNQSTPIAIIQAYNQAVAEMAKGLLRLAERRTTQDILPLVPSSLLAQALLKTGNDMLVINTTGQAIRWDINLEDYGGVIPTSKSDIVEACRIAQAKVNERWEDVTSSGVEDYLAYYNSKNHVLIAQVILDGPSQDACELRIEYDKDVRHLARPIAVDANLTFEKRLGLRWIKDMRDTKSVEFSDLALLDPNTALKDVRVRQTKLVDPGTLATIGVPDWCSSRPNKGADERAVCSDGQLSAFDILVNDYYRILFKALKSRAEKNRLSSEASAWRAKRKNCGEDTTCLEQIYRSAIDNLRDRIWDVEAADSIRRCRVSGCGGSDTDQPAPPLPN